MANRRKKPELDLRAHGLDSRGIPTDLDPRMFYEYAYEKSSTNLEAEGLEALLWKILPKTYIKSFAIAIDPFYKFKVGPDRVTSWNRTRYQVSNAAMGEIRFNYFQDQTSLGSTLIPGGGCVKDYWSTYKVIEDSTKVYNRFTDAQRYSLDTTSRTRLRGSDFGEAYIAHLWPNYGWRGNFYSAQQRLVSSSPVSCVEQRPNKSGYDATTRRVWPNGSALVLESHRETLVKATLQDKLYQALRRNSYELVRRALPTGRRYTFGRELIELKDLPRSIASLRKISGDLDAFYRSLGNLKTKRAFADLTGRSTAHIPNEYLSYHFGWKQLYDDVVNAVLLPPLLVKKFNYLIKRAGKQTTLRSHMKFVEEASGQPWMVYQGNETVMGSSVRDKFSYRLGATLTTTFDFPPLDLVKLRSDFLWQQLGLTPTPTDLYNVIPWSWLLDWFTGLSQYLHIIEEINSDPSLVNLGFVVGNLDFTRQLDYDHQWTSSFDYYSYNGVVFNSTSLKSRMTYSPQLLGTAYMRREVSGMAPVRSAGSLSNLTNFQQNILGALLAQRTQNHR